MDAGRFIRRGLGGLLVIPELTQQRKNGGQAVCMVVMFVCYDDV